MIVRHAEDDRRRLAVNVPALLEGRDERRVARQMGQEAQLDLGIVGRDQHRAGRGDEGTANGLAARRAHGDVLQVRVRGRQPSRGRPGLIEARVDAPGHRVDERRQGIDVGGFELRQLAVFDQQPGHLVPHRGELLQHLVVGRGAGFRLLEDRKLMLLEQHVPELRRRVEVELGSRGVIDRALERGQLAGEGQ